ncbi:MAG: hypothetical protein CK532_00320 [Flavobacteriales bacterium]|nr:dihydrofolate reductase [Flavobacteriaceae bacterium]PHX93142.1 MAG: hypothetical protein CK532_00320 [Flavobacteriales bacterium]
MRISIIAALGVNLELGANNALLWHLPDDFSWFIQHTKGKPLIMGRKTMESLGKPLKNRTNIVLTSALSVLPGFEIAENWDSALAMAKASILRLQTNTPSDSPGIKPTESSAISLKNSNKNIHQIPTIDPKHISGQGDEVMANSPIKGYSPSIFPEIMIIGGGEIYKQALDFTNRLYITQVKGNFPQADTHFPPWSPQDWKETYHQHHIADDKHNFSFDFRVFDRR